MVDTKEALLKYLSSQKVMALATFGNHVESCTVYFSVDKDLNFFFISNPETEHCKNIAINPKVAASIADDGQDVLDKKIGVQIKGIAEELSSIETVLAALTFWNKANFISDEPISVEQMKKKVMSSRAYKIKPTEIKFFNEALFSPGGYDILVP
ncbi:MAG: hypothetical protein ACD_81C00141G0008 [uncultured bacterium]|uniref:Pyridoxamine 5'-phosphate oxidase N-terminal domain-containing protein n=2 Tax=Candidatus Wolfeibacteriota TaxID=1752735 RepID=A0A0G1H784_9BACT|nr:MAG: hypothetical protein ACD_81C00141G0008 [uncultured bacterium]KKR12328.1 MAG: hypothetical protein UT41_C0002G0102 [Candidatus Wolfebacteria bacterium GW2011_GWC2_39_22]KKT43236.1 MAG: hypothetical protein UW32_C0002G0097 [Candidatus Wolfebacteria bacterium GW2011_GWE2_44_13]HBI25957.1 hypothetical protein [Candidatus Wolfebacteria bacterium]